MSDNELKNMKNFPQFILVRKPADISNLDATHLEHMNIMLRDT